jgi:hypothetical protein
LDAWWAAMSDFKKSENNNSESNERLSATSSRYWDQYLNSINTNPDRRDPPYFT